LASAAPLATFSGVRSVGWLESFLLDQHRLGGGWLARSIETVFRPGGLGWDRLASDPDTGRLAGLRDADRVAAYACRVLKSGFGHAESSIFTRHGEAFVLAHASGRGACT